MSNSLKIKKVILTVAVVAAACSAAGAIINSSADAEAQEREYSAPTPSASPAPIHTKKSVDQVRGTVNLLLIGTDERCTDYNDPGRGDMTMLCSLDADKKEVRLVSFERSIGMPWPGHGDIMLTNTYTRGGAELTMNDLQSCFNVPIDGYVHLDFDGFSRIIDAMGGIDIYLTAEEATALTEDMWYEQWFSEGDSHLDGAAALRYCRLRRTDDNWRRVERQRNAVQAVINKGKSLRLAGIKKLAEVAIPLVDTDLSKKEMLSLVFSAPKFTGLQARQMTVPDRSRIWTYEGAEGTVTGCDYGYESERINSFLYGTEE